MNKDKYYLIKYWTYLKKHKVLMTLGLLLIPLTSGCLIIQPILIKKGIDNHILQKDISGLYWTAILFAGSILFEFLFKSLQSFIFQYIGQKTVTEIRHDLFNHVLNFSPSYFDKNPIGIVTSRLTSDMESLNESFASGLVTLLGDILTLLGILTVMFWLSPKLTFITLLVIPPLFLVVNFFRIKLRKYFNKTRTIIGKLNGYLQEQMQGIEIIQLFQREKKNFETFNTYNNEYKKATIGAVVYDAILYSFVESASIITIAVLIWYGFGLHLEGIITLGLLIAFMEYINKFFTPLKELSNKFAVLQHALASLEKIFGLFDIKDSIPSGPIQLKEAKGKVVFKNVNYAYKGHEDHPVLKNISFTINPNEVVALVGPTGSGKSTVIRLLTRLYDQYDGSITFDDYEISELETNSLRSKMAIVSQDIEIFKDTYEFNITLGNKKILREQMIEAAKTVQLNSLITSQEKSYQTILKQGKNSLSTGQAQLLSFARALATQSPLILLDEATASVDSLSEKLIQKALDGIFKNRTVLVVAHRLSTIQKADKIITLNHGEIIETGTHDELLNKNGFYANLFNMQFNH